MALLLVGRVRPVHSLLPPPSSRLALAAQLGTQGPVYDPDGPMRSLVVDEVDDIAVSPDGNEVAIACSRGLVRWRSQTGGQRKQRWPPGIWPTQLSFSSDGAHLIANTSTAIHLISLTGELKATIELVAGRHWFASSPSGAVDGSPGVARELLSVIAEPGSTTAHLGSLAWDRFEVPGLLALLVAGKQVRPPL